MIWIVVEAFIAFALHHGLGRHVYYLSLNPEYLVDLGQVLKRQSLVELPTAFSLFFFRISICLFLLRVFRSDSLLETNPLLCYSLYDFDEHSTYHTYHNTMHANEKGLETFRSRQVFELRSDDFCRIL